MTSPPADLSASHDRHDRLLISATVAGDATAAERARAETLMRMCGGCAALANDLRAIAEASRGLPARMRPLATDYRLTIAAARRLDRGGGWRRLFRWLAQPRSPAPPLSAALTTLGIAGLMLATIPLAPLGAGGALQAAAPSQNDTRFVTESAAPQAVPPAGLGDGSNGTTAGGLGPLETAAHDPTGAPEAAPAETDAKSTGFGTRDDGPRPGVPALGVLAAGFLAAGLGLFALRRIARRLD